jgi:hypothetical protein
MSFLLDVMDDMLPKAKFLELPHTTCGEQLVVPEYGG